MKTITSPACIHARKSNVLAVTCILLFCTSTLFAQDINPPLLHSITISPGTIQAHGETLTLTAQMTDDISGLYGNGLPIHTYNNGSYVVLKSMTDDTRRYMSVWQSVTGDFYKTEINWNVYNTTGGAWMVEEMILKDYGGNVKSYRDGVDFTVHFVVPPKITQPVPDTIPPQLISFDILTDTVNAPGQFRCRVVATDASALNYQSGTSIMSPLYGSQYGNTTGLTVDTTAPNTYIFGRNMIVWDWGGYWTVEYVRLTDIYFNTATYRHNIDFNGKFFVNDSLPDYEKPVMHSLTFTPAVAHRGDTITTVIELTDNLSGVKNGDTEVFFANQYNQQLYTAQGWTSLGNNLYRNKRVVSPFAADGRWKVTQIRAGDKAGRSTTILDSAVLAPYYYVVAPDSGLLIEGVVVNDTGAPVANSRVYMVKKRPPSSVPYVMRVDTTDNTGTYQFYSELGDTLIYIKAIPDTAYANLVPTYLDASTTLSGARQIHITSNYTLLDTLRTSTGTNTGGFGFISGFVHGAGKRQGAPVAGVQLVLATTAGDALQHTFTDSTGYFIFLNIPEGDYMVYPVSDSVQLALSPVFTISDTSSYTDVLFTYHTTHITKDSVTIDPTGIKAIQSPFSIFPNPVESVLFIRSVAANYLHLQLFDTFGKECLVVPQVENEQITLDLKQLPAGVYFLRVNGTVNKIIKR